MKFLQRRIRQMRLIVRRGRISILSICRIQRDSPHNLTIFQPNMSSDSKLLETFLIDNDLTRTPNPATIASIASVLAKAEVYSTSMSTSISMFVFFPFSFVALPSDDSLLLNTRDFSIPLITPRIPMIVPRKECHHTGNRSDSFHKGDVLLTIITALAVFPICTPPLSLLRKRLIVIDSRLTVCIYTSLLLSLLALLESQGSVGRDVDESYRRDCSASSGFGCDGGTGGFEPVYY